MQKTETLSLSQYIPLLLPLEETEIQLLSSTPCTRQHLFAQIAATRRRVSNCD